MTHAIVGRWGKNLALRFPIEIASQLSLREGDRLEIETGPDRIVIHRAKPVTRLKTCSPARPRPNGARCTPMPMIGDPTSAAKSSTNDGACVATRRRQSVTASGPTPPPGPLDIYARPATLCSIPGPPITGHLQLPLLRVTRATSQPAATAFHHALSDK